MAVILEGSALMLECAGCGELYLEGDSPARRKEGALEAWREKHTACPVVPVQLAAAAPALEDDATGLVKQLAPDLTEVHARAIAVRLLERYEIQKIPGRLEAATRMVAELGAQLVRSRRLEARPGLLEELERLRAALTAAACIGCGQVLPDAASAARHVEACLKHPLGQARQRVAALEASLEDVQELAGRILPGIDLSPYTTHGQVAMVGDHLELERVETAKLRKRVAQLEAEACRFYRADGTYEVMPPEQVVERRILAARRLAALEPAPTSDSRDQGERSGVTQVGVCDECRQTVPLVNGSGGWMMLASHQSECMGSGTLGYEAPSPSADPEVTK